MRIFRASYKDKSGQIRQVKKWWIELKDHLQIIRRFPAFTDKQASELFGQQIQRLINLRAAGEQPDTNLSGWLEKIPVKTRRHFAKIGILDAQRAEGGKPLSEHLTDFEKYLLAKGSKLRHCRQTARALNRVFAACSFRTWTDISAERFLRYIAAEEKSEKTLTEDF